MDQSELYLVEGQGLRWLTSDKALKLAIFLRVKTSLALTRARIRWAMRFRPDDVSELYQQGYFFGYL